jgi:cobalt-zinc-cadmium efflux system protein
MAEHPHGETEASDRVLAALKGSVLLSIAIFLIEASGALLSRSLSLTTDAVHDLPDILAFSVSWTAVLGTRRGSTGTHTYGTHRLEVFAGILNGGLVLATGLLFAYEASASLLAGRGSAGVDALWILVAAVPTLALRSASLFLLQATPRPVRDLNLSGVILHVSSDIAITLALLGAGGILLADPGARWVDAAAALLIAVILLAESYPLLREGWQVLAERTPHGLSLEKIRSEALSVPGVTELHDLHVWAICSTLVCMTAHVGVGDVSLAEGLAVVDRLRGRMAARFGILHATFELENPVAAGRAGVRATG